MFEKSLYDLIRGLRNHRGSEREYIQSSLRECRHEIKGSDMDLKATALLKLIYLEMFGYDMSWASFHVLEVMSCPKYIQKRVGYLAAVQSFRTDTEVLMLATNLLKKDVSSPVATTMSLPLVALPHIITSSLALSLLLDLMPRLSHSNPSIRKKTVAALYRLALVYPDTLRSAWPKIKDILMNEKEDTSVTAAVVNVVCELGWRRPRDFLALAPRLFDLLIEGGNNWMAIKIIKLFAILTPLEPRLIKKLLPPLVDLIRTTPAMSLLYECINGIIKGGILDGEETGVEDDDIASLCVNKLRGMIVVEGDPNLKYVALLAFNRIVASHPYLVSMQQDVILSCIDDPDISIRLQALELGASMVNSSNLVAVVERLLKQLSDSPISNDVADIERDHPIGIEPSADSDAEDPEEALRSIKGPTMYAPTLPIEYRTTVIRQILQMCRADTYTNIIDFDWYIKILMQLVKLVPSFDRRVLLTADEINPIDHQRSSTDEDISSSIGWELRNVAVRVSAVRAEAVQAANALISLSRSPNSSGMLGVGGFGVLQYAAWMVGEYVGYCVDPHGTLDALLGTRPNMLTCEAICAYIQAIPKIFAHIVSKQATEWDREQKSVVSLLLARVIDFLEPLSTHPYLEIQERSVEFLELMRIASQASAAAGKYDGQAPLLLTQAISELFAGFELNPVAPSAQGKVPLQRGLDLDSPLNEILPELLRSAEFEAHKDTNSAEFQAFYTEKPSVRSSIGPVLDKISSNEVAVSYHQTGDSGLDPEELLRKRIMRRERNRDDPFYITKDDASSGPSTPFHDIPKSSSCDDVDIDAIPIMNLDLGDKVESGNEIKQPKPRRSNKVHVVKDETLEHEGLNGNHFSAATVVSDSNPLHRSRDKGKRSVLEVDSSNIGSIPLTDSAENAQVEAQNDFVSQDKEMAKALAEVERLRLEMQRASERIQASDGTPAEGTLVKKRKKKKVTQRGSEKASAHFDSQQSATELPVKSPRRRKKKKKQREGEHKEDVVVKLEKERIPIEQTANKKMANETS